MQKKVPQRSAGVLGEDAGVGRGWSCSGSMNKEGGQQEFVFKRAYNFFFFKFKKR